MKRRNALFAGHDEGGRNWARFASLIGTFKMNGVEPHAYLRYLFTSLDNDQLAKNIVAVMPWAYAQAAKPAGMSLEREAFLSYEQASYLLRTPLRKPENQWGRDGAYGFVVFMGTVLGAAVAVLDRLSASESGLADHRLAVAVAIIAHDFIMWVQTTFPVGFIARVIFYEFLLRSPNETDTPQLSVSRFLDRKARQ